MRINATKQDRIWSLAGIILSMGANFLVLPVILLYLDDEAIGLYYIFTSIGAVTALFDFGFSPSIARSMAYAWSGAEKLVPDGASPQAKDAPNYVLMKRIIRTCKLIYLGLSCCALLLALTAGTIYISSITASLKGYVHYIAWLVYAAAIFFNLLYGYYTVYLRGVGAVADVNKAMVISRCIQIVSCSILLIMGTGLVGVAIAHLGYGLMFRLIAKNKFYRYKGIGEKIESVRLTKEQYTIKEILWAIWPNAWRDGLVTLSKYLLNQATTIVASLYLSLADTGVYSLCVQLTTAIATIAGAFLSAYLPSLQSAFINRDVEKQKSILSLVVCSYISFEIIGALGMMLVCIPVIHMLKPTYRISILLFLLVGFYQFILKFINCYSTYISTTNRLIYARSFIVSSIACVVLSVAFAGGLKLGVYGLVAAQILSQIAYCAWKWALFVHRELNISPYFMIRLGFAEMRNLVPRFRKSVVDN